MELPPHLREALDGLLARSEDARKVTLDEIGDAIGTGAVDANQIDFILGDLESKGRTIVAPSGQNGVAALMKILPAARALQKELGRTARVNEIAERTGLSDEEVRRALLLARVMAR
jgi:hypothetical protein